MRRLPSTSAVFMVALVAGAAPARADSAATPAGARTPVADEPAPSDLGGADQKEHLRVGVIGGIAFPRPLAVEAMIKLERAVSLGLEYSSLPTTRVGDVQFGWHAIALDARVFPLRSPFFLGARIARQHLDGLASVTAGAYGTYSGAIATDTWYVEPRIGLLWTSKIGITVGMDAGLEVPLGHTSSAVLPPQVELPSAVARVQSLFGASVLPTVTLLSLGALF